MIMDNLAQWRRYSPVSSPLGRAFVFLESLDVHCPDGKYPIDGDNVFCLVQRYRSKPVEKAAFEAHRKYTDVQYIIAGNESILWAPLASLTTVTQPFDVERDIGFCATPAEHTALRLCAGQFAVLFPEDGHAPGIVSSESSDVVKAVVKVRL